MQRTVVYLATLCTNITRSAAILTQPPGIWVASASVSSVFLPLLLFDYVFLELKKIYYYYYY